jgi:hypothetical protein
MPRFYFAALLTSLCAAGAALAHVGPLDPTFGDGGMRHYGFQAVNGLAGDRAIAACAGANGTLTATGAASSGQRIVTVRLRENGDYDTSFSDDGKASFDLPGTPSDFTPGLCQSSGHLVVARSLTAGDGEQNVQIFRVHREDGLLDPGFGNGGVVAIDLDQWAGGLGKEEMPLGINQLANGDIAVSGRVTLAAGGERGFAIVLGNDGSVRGVTVLSNIRSRTATTVSDAPDGRLWVFGQNGRVNGAFRATLARDTLAWEAVLEQLAPAGYTTWVGSGRVLDANTVVLGSTTGPTPGYEGVPQLIVFRAASVSVLLLPAATLDGQAYGLTARFGVNGVTVLPRRRVLIASLAHPPGTGPDAGVHFAMGEIGVDASGDRIDPRFGTGGAQTAAFRPAVPQCTAVRANHRFGRLTLWRGRPAFVGGVDASCTAPDTGEDYLVARIRTDDIFADAFDGS